MGSVMLFVCRQPFSLRTLCPPTVLRPPGEENHLETDVSTALEHREFLLVHKESMLSTILKISVACVILYVIWKIWVQRLIFPQTTTGPSTTKSVTAASSTTSTATSPSVTTPSPSPAHEGQVFSTTPAPFITTTPAPTYLSIAYRGASNSEDMEVYINGQSVYHDPQCPSAQKLYRMPVDAWTPIKNITIEFKNDAAGRDLFMDKIELGGVDIRSKFVGPSSLDATRQAAVREGKYAWTGKYVYTA
jgi:hypothetical protein